MIFITLASFKGRGSGLLESHTTTYPRLIKTVIQWRICISYWRVCWFHVCLLGFLIYFFIISTLYELNICTNWNNFYNSLEEFNILCQNTRFSSKIASKLKSLAKFEYGCQEVLVAILKMTNKNCNGPTDLVSLDIGPSFFIVKDQVTDCNP